MTRPCDTSRSPIKVTLVWLLELQVNPAYHDLHSDARYQELIRRIGLPLWAGAQPR